MTTNSDKSDNKISEEQRDNNENKVKETDKDSVEKTQPTQQIQATQPIARQPSGPIIVQPTTQVTQPIARQPLGGTYYDYKAVRNFRYEEVVSTCPQCGTDSLTVKKLQAGKLAVVSSIAAGLITSCFCCCCCTAPIPWLIEEFYTINHECRNCTQLIGTYKIW